jgi:hypothetical protein
MGDENKHELIDLSGFGEDKGTEAGKPCLLTGVHINSTTIYLALLVRVDVFINECNVSLLYDTISNTYNNTMAIT